MHDFLNARWKVEFISRKESTKLEGRYKTVFKTVFGRVYQGRRSAATNFRGGHQRVDETADFTGVERISESSPFHSVISSIFERGNRHYPLRIPPRRTFPFFPTDKSLPRPVDRRHDVKITRESCSGACPQWDVS